MPTLLTIRQTADMLSLSTQTVRRLTRDGAIPVARLGKSVRYREADVLAYIASQTTGGLEGADHE